MAQVPAKFTIFIVGPDKAEVHATDGDVNLRQILLFIRILSQARDEMLAWQLGELYERSKD